MNRLNVLFLNTHKKCAVTAAMWIRVPSYTYINDILLLLLHAEMPQCVLLLDNWT